MITILTGDCREVLKTLPFASINCCVTSPPYWGLRDYGVDGQIGMEKTPGDYVAGLVAVFREVWRVLRNDGTLWLNLGDTYNAYNGNRGTKSEYAGKRELKEPAFPKGAGLMAKDLKPKDLVGIPWTVALALRAEGWYLRSDIIWAKPNPMPESVTDRPTKSHEYIFLLTKSERYFWDQEAVREKAVTGWNGSSFTSAQDKATKRGIGTAERIEKDGRNLRSVWSIATEPFSGAHFATFPTALVERCIKAGTSEKGCCGQCKSPWIRVVEKSRITPKDYEGKYFGTDMQSAGRRMLANVRARRESGEEHDHPFPPAQTIGWQPSCSCPDFLSYPVPAIILDPFSGAGTTLLVADRLGRDSIGIELNEKYIKMARHRIEQDAPLFTQVTE